MDSGTLSWLHGNVEGAQQYIDQHLRKLISSHPIPGGLQEVDDAVRALNRLHQRIENTKPQKGRTK